MSPAPSWGPRSAPANTRRWHYPCLCLRALYSLVIWRLYAGLYEKLWYLPPAGQVRVRDYETMARVARRAGHAHVEGRACHCRPPRPGDVGAPLAFPAVNRFRMAGFDGRAAACGPLFDALGAGQWASRTSWPARRSRRGRQCWPTSRRCSSSTRSATPPRRRSRPTLWASSCTPSAAPGAVTRPCSTVNHLSVALLYGPEGCLAARFGGFRRGQTAAGDAGALAKAATYHRHQVNERLMFLHGSA